jgi:hypothetical protein
VQVPLRNERRKVMEQQMVRISVEVRSGSLQGGGSGPEQEAFPIEPEGFFHEQTRKEAA